LGEDTGHMRTDMREDVREELRADMGRSKRRHVVSRVFSCLFSFARCHVVERWGAGVETQKYVRGDIGGWGRVPSNETYAPSLSTIYDGA